MVKEGYADDMIAYLLSKEGYRQSCRMYVTIGFVGRIRCAAGLKIARNKQARNIDGGLTLGQAARRINATPDWVLQQLLCGKISLVPDEIQKRFIIPADSKTMGKLKDLRKEEIAVYSQGGVS
jgi:hypothetical protein